VSNRLARGPNLTLNKCVLHVSFETWDTMIANVIQPRWTQSKWTTRARNPLHNQKPHISSEMRGTRLRGVEFLVPSGG
jgi:hypothetical protein